jgi:hypothetical protein
VEGNKTCRIHGIELQPTMVAVTYGLIDSDYFDDFYFDERRTLFPPAPQLRGVPDVQTPKSTLEQRRATVGARARLDQLERT